MGFKDLFLDLLVLEVRYPYGHLYWDRCGQSILDIERQCFGWFSAKQENITGRLENPEKNLVVVFNEQSFSFTARKLREPYLDEFTEEMQKIWRILQANFGLEEYDRIGLRFHYLIPKKSIEEAEAGIERSMFNINLPQQLSNPQYNCVNRHIISILNSEDIEYRVELKSVIRSEGIDPSSLLTGRPDRMSKKQKEYRLQKMKQLRDFSINPMYAIMLDIDCSMIDIDQLNIKEFISNQHKIVSRDFLTILERL